MFYVSPTTNQTDMEKAFKFLQQQKDVAFATVEGGRPRIRVFQIMGMEGRTLYFATAPGKAVFRQLQVNPHVEILAMQGNLSVRAAGRVCFDMPDDMARRLYAANPVLPRLYRRYTDLAYFRLPVAWLDYYDLTPDPPILEHEAYEPE